MEKVLVDAGNESKLIQCAEIRKKVVSEKL